MLYGPPGVGKSFVALDLAHSIGAGIKWLGRRVRQGYAVYVAAGEGVPGLRQRLDAWEHERDLSITDVGYLTEAVQLHQSSHVQKFLKTIRDLNPVLVVFDTLARCLTGANENSAEGMGLAIGAADAIRATGAAVLFVHHTGHPDEDGPKHRPRGFSGLPAAVDTMIELGCEGDPDSTDERVMRCRKQKDSEPFHPIRCRLKAVRKGGRTLSLVPVA